MVSIPSPIHTEARAAIRRLSDISGENIYKCMQCGTCSAVCPMVESMGFTTRQGIHLLQFGRTEDVIRAEIGEFCASCHTCTVRCPRGIDIPALMEAIRQLRLRQGEDLVNPRAIPAEKLRKLPPIAMVAGFRELTL